MTREMRVSEILGDLRFKYCANNKGIEYLDHHERRLPRVDYLTESEPTW